MTIIIKRILLSRRHLNKLLVTALIGAGLSQPLLAMDYHNQTVLPHYQLRLTPSSTNPSANTLVGKYVVSPAKVAQFPNEIPAAVYIVHTEEMDWSQPQAQAIFDSASAVYGEIVIPVPTSVYDPDGANFAADFQEVIDTLLDAIVSLNASQQIDWANALEFMDAFYAQRPYKQPLTPMISEIDPLGDGHFDIHNILETTGKAAAAGAVWGAQGGPATSYAGAMSATAKAATFATVKEIYDVTPNPSQVIDAAIDTAKNLPKDIGNFCSEVKDYASELGHNLYCDIADLFSWSGFDD